MTRRMFMPVILLALLLVACQPVVVIQTPYIITATPDVVDTPIVKTPPPPTDVGDPTPTQEHASYDKDCRLPGGFYEFLNSNPCMVDPVRINADQEKPVTYGFVELRADANGHTGPENYANLIPVYYDESSKDFRFAVGTVAGEVGFYHVFQLDEPSCLIVQVLGDYQVEDPNYTDNRSNYAHRAEIERIVGVEPQSVAHLDLGLQFFPEANQGGLEPLWSVDVREPGTIVVTVVVNMRFATAPPGAWVGWESFAVARADPGWCSGSLQLR